MKKYDYMQIGIASPEEIRSWSHGEVKKHGQDKRVEAVIIDTDIGSLNKNTNIDPIFRIQTSENSTVRGLLERDPSCKEWFPEHPVILNSQKQILISQRSELKEKAPLKWECNGGALLSSEDAVDGIVREIYEELGIKLDKDKAIYLKTAKNAHRFKEIYLFEKDVYGKWVLKNLL